MSSGVAISDGDPGVRWACKAMPTLFRAAAISTPRGLLELSIAALQGSTAPVHVLPDSSG
jgi:hypothetical protein